MTATVAVLVWTRPPPCSPRHHITSPHVREREREDDDDDEPTSVAGTRCLNSQRITVMMMMMMIMMMMIMMVMMIMIMVIMVW